MTSNPEQFEFAQAPPKAKLGEVEIAYERTGAGDPVVLIMGLGTGRRGWKYQMGPLSKHYDVVAFDHRGVGDSDAPAEGWTIGDMANDAMLLMDHLGFERGHLVGTSVGGIVAQEMVLSHPDRALSLALIASNHGGDEAVPTVPEVLDEIRPAMGGDPKAGEAAIRHSFSDGYLQQHPEVLDQVIEEAKKYPTTAQGLRNQVFAAVKWTMAGGSVERLDQIAVPTLVLHGGEDKLVPVPNAHMLADRIPGARLRIWEDSGHNVIFEKTDELNEELLSHFAAAAGVGA